MASNFEKTPGSMDDKSTARDGEAEMKPESEEEGVKNPTDNQNETAKDPSQNIDTKSDGILEQHLKEIRDKASEISCFLTNEESKNLETVTTALKDAEEFMEDKKQKMGDAFDVEENHRKVETLEIAINTLKQRKEELEKEKEPETAKDFIKVLREEQERLAERAAYSMRGLRIFEKAEGGEPLTEDEQREYNGMKENGITKAKLTERLRVSTNNNVAASAMEMATTALREARKQAGSSEDFSRYINDLDTTTKILLERIGIKEKSMLEQQAQAVEKLEEAEVEGMDYFIGADGERIRRKDLREGDKKIFDEIAGNGQEAKVPAEDEGKEDEGEGKYVEEVERSIGSSSYQHLIKFFREKTSKSEARNEMARLLFIANKGPLSDKIMALPDDWYMILDKNKTIEPAGDGKGEIGTIVIKWKDAPYGAWRKTTIKASFKDYEDSGSLSFIDQALTSKEKSIGISVFEEDINTEQNVQEEDKENGQDGANTRVRGKHKDILGDSLTEKQINDLEKEEVEKGNPGSEENKPDSGGIDSSKQGIVEESLGGDIEPKNITAEIKSEDKEIEDMTLYEIKAGSSETLKTELSPNNDFAASVGTGGSSFLSRGGIRIGLGTVEKIFFFDKDKNDKKGESMASFERNSMQEGDYVVIETNHEGKYYILSIKGKEKAILREMKAVDTRILPPKENSRSENSAFTRLLNRIAGHTVGGPTKSA